MISPNICKVHHINSKHISKSHSTLLLDFFGLSASELDALPGNHETQTDVWGKRYRCYQVNVMGILIDCTRSQVCLIRLPFLSDQRDLTNVGVPTRGKVSAIHTRVNFVTFLSFGSLTCQHFLLGIVSNNTGNTRHCQ